MKKYTNTDKTWHFSAKYEDVDFIRIFNEVPSDCNLVSIEMGFVKLLAMRETYYLKCRGYIKTQSNRCPAITSDFNHSVNLYSGSNIPDWRFCFASSEHIESIPSLSPKSLDEIESYFERVQEIKYFSKRKSVMVHVECR